MKIATKLTKRVAEFVNEKGIGAFIYIEEESYFLYPQVEKNGHLFGVIMPGYTLVSEQEFIDMVTAELNIVDDLTPVEEALNNRQFESGSIRDNDDNKPLVNHLDAYVRLRFGYHLRKGATKYGKGNWQKGQPDETALESLNRHLALHELGDRSEDHMSAIIFNVQLIMMNEKSNGIKTDNYFEL